MIINCTTVEELVIVVAGLVNQGLTFEAYMSDLTIRLTGGY
tara:strand:+ start:572 stop:694 length:123 start_codon:yes stop_codon:yes gene_type:complete